MAREALAKRNNLAREALAKRNKSQSSKKALLASEWNEMMQHDGGIMAEREGLVKTHVCWPYDWEHNKGSKPEGTTLDMKFKACDRCKLSIARLQAADFFVGFTTHPPTHPPSVRSAPLFSSSSRQKADPPGRAPPERPLPVPQHALPHLGPRRVLHGLH